MLIFLFLNILSDVDISILQVFKDDSIILSRVLPDKKFQICYIHSVEKIPVYEFFEIMPDGNVRLYETRFQSYGAGISNQEDGFIYDGTFFKVLLNREFREFYLYVSSLDGQSLIFKNDVVVLKEIANEYDLLVFRTKTVKFKNLINFFKFY